MLRTGSGTSSQNGGLADEHATHAPTSHPTSTTDSRTTDTVVSTRDLSPVCCHVSTQHDLLAN